MTPGGRLGSVQTGASLSDNGASAPVVDTVSANQPLSSHSRFAQRLRDSVPAVAQALTAAGVNLKRLQPLGTGLWDDPRVFAEPALEGGWFDLGRYGFTEESWNAHFQANTPLRRAGRLKASERTVRVG